MYVLYYRVVRVQETRVTGAAAHILIGVSVLLVDNVLQYIPVPVLYGVFCYLGLQALTGNHFWSRLLLLVTEQAHYPPSDFLRKVPQKQIHLFTLVQAVAVVVFCVLAFFPNPYLVSVFPVVIVLLVPVRWFLLPRLFGASTVHVLDSE